MSWAHYLLQANIYLVVFYAFYKLLLAKETYFSLNRLYLLAAALLAMIIPFLRVEWLYTAQNNNLANGMNALNDLVSEATIASDRPETFPVGSILAMVYLLGVLFFSGRFLYQLLKVNELLKSNRYSNDHSGKAFSFFNQLVIDPSLPEHQTIEHHEQVHSRQWHSMDVVIFEILGILCWFNPVIYFYKNSLKSIHEYLADEEAAQFIGDKQHYALLLVSKSFGVPVNSLTNSFFNQSLLKNRIKMLNQEKSPKKALLKYGLYLPVFGLTLLLSSATLRSNEQIAAFTASVPLEQPLALIQNLTSEQKQGGWDDFYHYAQQAVKYPKQALSQKLQGDANIKFSLKAGVVENLGIAGKATGGGFDTEVMKSILAYNKFNAIPDGDYLLTVAFRMKDSDKSPEQAGGVALDGYTKLNTLAINAGNTIHDFISIDQAPAFPGGMPKFYEYLSRAIKYPKEAATNNVQGKVFLSFIVEKNGELTNVHVDRKLGAGTDEEAIRVIEGSPRWNPGILAGQPVRVKYNLPISFALSKKDTDSSSNKVGDISSVVMKSDKKPVIYVDGIKSDEAQMKSLNPNEIASINILKEESAVNIYGADAKAGVILITTKAKVTGLTGKGDSQADNKAADIKVIKLESKKQL